MKKNYRGICLIGAGRAGMIHARNFQRSVPGFRIVSVADPVEEARAGVEILRAAGLKKGGIRFVSCPTCGRTEIDLIGLAHEVEERLRGVERDITVAVMGCVVNGPGEAGEADYGVAGGRGCGLLFKKGEIVRKVPEGELCSALMELIESGEGL